MIQSVKVSPLSIALGYVFIAALWILFSDRTLEYLADTAETLSILQSIKGLFFVVATGCLLYFFADRLKIRIETQEEEKRKKEKEFQKIFESNPNPMLVYDRHSNGILEVNKAATKKYGYVKSEFFKKNPDDLLYDKSNQITNVYADKDNNGDDLIDCTHKTKNGSLLQVKVNNQSIDYNGTEAYLMIVYDVTEQEEALQKLRHAYEQLNYHISNTPLGVIEWDEEFRVKFWSDRAQEIFGWKADEVIGIDPDSRGFVHEDDREWVKRVLKNLIDYGNEGFQISNRNYHKDGSVRYCQWFNSRIINHHENSISVLSLVHDVTDQQLSQQRLDRYQQRFEIAAELASDVIWEWDVATDDIWFSDSIRDRFQRDELVGTVPLSRWEKYVEEDKRARVISTLREYARHGKGIWQEKYRFQKGDGTYAHVIDRGQMQFDENGHPYRMIGTMIDETEHRIYEEKMRQWNKELEEQVRERTKELENVNSELEAFTYSVSHDLKAPVRSIDGFSRTLKEHLGESLDEEGQIYLDKVINAGERMGQLINDLLKLSRITRKEIHYEQVNLSEVVNEIFGELRQMEPERRVQYQCDEEIVVSGDKKLIRIMMENLLNNSWKFTRNKRDASISINGSEHDGICRIVIQDNGDGFDQKYAGKLFHPFHRLHQKNEFEGTGIGLATVKRIAVRHNASITANGEKGSGAMFQIAWPVR